MYAFYSSHVNPRAYLLPLFFRMAVDTSGLESCMIDFCLDIFKEVVGNSPSDNVFLSPSSIMVVMAMAHLGARGVTRDQMTEALRFNHFKERIPHDFIGNFTNSLQRDKKDLLLKNANRLFSSQSGIIDDQYVETMRMMFSSDVKLMDFKHFPDESRLEINQWVESETNGIIKNLLAKGVITGDTALVVVNAVYFKVSWTSPFKKELTSLETFYTSESNTENVNMMQGKLDHVGFYLSEELDFSVLELPYGSEERKLYNEDEHDSEHDLYDREEISMYIFLPNKRFGLWEMENKLSLRLFQSVLSSIRRTTVKVSLPKFRLEASYELNDVLSSLGMPDAFDPENANFAGISQTRIWIDKVVHKAFVEVDEIGTEASAATGVTFVLCSAKIGVPQFKADHPFLFVIYDKIVNVPLFIGRVTSPVGDRQRGKYEL